MIADDSGAAQVSYTYDPFGVVIEENDNGNPFDNPFKFTGQWYDEEISQYYLRARMYDPRLMRFTGYDPVRGGFKEPMTLHRYLYCINNPVNFVDPDGEIAAAVLVVGMVIGGVTSGIDATSDGWDGMDDVWTICRGIGTGMFGAMMPSTFFGIVGGMGIPLANSAYGSWLEGETMQEWGERTAIGQAGGASATLLSAHYFRNFSSLSAGFLAYAGAEIGGCIYSLIFDGIYEWTDEQEPRDIVPENPI